MFWLLWMAKKFQKSSLEFLCTVTSIRYKYIGQCNRQVYCALKNTLTIDVNVRLLAYLDICFSILRLYTLLTNWYVPISIFLLKIKHICKIKIDHFVRYNSFKMFLLKSIFFVNMTFNLKKRSLRWTFWKVLAIPITSFYLWSTYYESNFW